LGRKGQGKRKKPHLKIGGNSWVGKKGRMQKAVAGGKGILEEERAIWK